MVAEAGGESQNSEPGAQIDGSGKSCPHCGEALRDSAVTCRFCGRDLANPDAPPLALSGDTWDTEVPGWMVEREQQAALRRRTASRLSEVQWSVLCTATTALIALVTLRLAQMPMPPPPPAALAQAVYRTAAAAPPAPAQKAFVSAVAATTLASPAAPKPSPSEETPAPAPTTSISPASLPGPEPSSLQDSRAAGTSITATDLVRRFAASRTDAGEEFDSKVLTVSGVVKACGVNERKNGFITLFADGSDVLVQCIFDGKQKLDVKRVEVGSAITVRGVCGGFFVDVNLTECDLP